MGDLRVETPSAQVRLFTLSRAAKRNALSFELIAALREQLQQAEADGIRAVVIAGDGPTFSAGADFSQLKGDVSDLAFDDAMSELTSALMHGPLISFAAIRGGCVGAGLDLALACDFRIASPDAFFALPAARLGILYNPRRLSELESMLAAAIMRRLLVLAETLDCEEASRGGIVTHRAGSGANAAVDAALEHASQAASLPPLAQRAGKAFLASRFRKEHEQADWQKLRMELLASDERKVALEKARTSRK